MLKRLNGKLVSWVSGSYEICKKNLFFGRGLDILDQHIAIQVGNPPHKGIVRGTNQIFLIRLVREKSYRDVVTLNEGELM